MSNRRQFIAAGTGAALAASSLTAAGYDARPASASPRRVCAAGLFIYQPSAAEAIEAGRVMAGQGIRVLGLDASDPSLLEQTLGELWARGPTPVVGLTDEAGFRQVQDLAQNLGLRQPHSARADSGILIHWVVDPS